MHIQYIHVVMIWRREGADMVFMTSCPPSKPRLTEIKAEEFAVYMDLVVSTYNDDGWMWPAFPTMPLVNFQQVDTDTVAAVRIYWWFDINLLSVYSTLI